MNYSSPNIYTDDAGIKMPRHEASQVPIVLADQTRKYSRNLLFCLMVMVAITLLGFEPKTLALIGVALDQGNISLEFAVLYLSVFFAAWGVIPWWNDLRTYQERFKKKELDFDRAISDILHKAVLFPEDREHFVDRVIVDQAKLKAAIIRREKEIADSPSDNATKKAQIGQWRDNTEKLPNEIRELERLRPVCKRSFYISQVQHYWFFAAVVPLCGVLLIWDLQTNQPPEPVSWCYGAGAPYGMFHSEIEPIAPRSGGGG